MKANISKAALNNIIKHVYTHNRIKEEEECWKQRSKELKKESKRTETIEPFTSRKRFRESDEDDSSYISKTKISCSSNNGTISFKNISKVDAEPYISKSNELNSKKAYMDVEADIRPCKYEGREDHSSNYWIRQYDKYESTCLDRWGHSGYKTLHPEEFISTDDEKEDKSFQFNKEIIDSAKKISIKKKKMKQKEKIKKEKTQIKEK